ncbi:hypothetical protein ACQZV8_11265 [Magnetococcales bacterium HHB-1]
MELPDPNDRHVLAAAIKAEAEVIVTFNQKDFPSDILKGFGIFTAHPDKFVANLIDLNGAVVVSTVRDQRSRLINPPISSQDFLDILRSQQLTRTAVFLQDRIDLI